MIQHTNTLATKLTRLHTLGPRPVFGKEGGGEGEGVPLGAFNCPWWHSFPGIASLTSKTLLRITVTAKSPHKNYIDTAMGTSCFLEV